MRSAHVAYAIAEMLGHVLLQGVEEAERRVTFGAPQIRHCQTELYEIAFRIVKAHRVGID